MEYIPFHLPFSKQTLNAFLPRAQTKLFSIDREFLNKLKQRTMGDSRLVKQLDELLKPGHIEFLLDHYNNKSFTFI